MSLLDSVLLKKSSWQQNSFSVNHVFGIKKIGTHDQIEKWSGGVGGGG